MIKRILLLMTLFTLTMNIYAQESTIGAPDEDCNCGPIQTNTEQVIEAMSQTDMVVPIMLYYKRIKLGSANLSITHVDGKILNAKIVGKISAMGFNDSVTELLDIEDLSRGRGINYYSNTTESPILSVKPVSITPQGGTVNLEVKMKNSNETIPLNISLRNGRFQAQSNGRVIKKLKINLGFNLGQTISQKLIIDGHVSNYTIY